MPPNPTQNGYEDFKLIIQRTNPLSTPEALQEEIL